jgi:hypothetical protein
VSESCGGYCWFQQAVVGLNGTITFTTQVAVGGGGFSVFSKSGFTSVNDAGAAGPSIFYNPTTNYVYLRNAASTYFFALGSADMAFRGGNTYFTMNSASATPIQFWASTPGTGPSQVDIGGNGWLLPKGVVFEDEFDGPAIDASKWTVTVGAGGASVAVTPARGGIWNFQSIAAANPTYAEGIVRTISRQDAYRFYSRFRKVQATNIFLEVGLCDAMGGRQEEIVVRVDTGGATPNNWTFDGMVGGAPVSVDTTIAHDQNHHIFEFIQSGTSYTLYIDGTLRATLTNAQYPAAATMLERVLRVYPLGGAVMSNIYIDTYKLCHSRNTGNGDT